MQKSVRGDENRQVPAIDPIKHLGETPGFQAFADHEAILLEAGKLCLVQAKIKPAEEPVLRQVLGIAIEIVPKPRRGGVPGKFVDVFGLAWIAAREFLGRNLADLL